MWRSYFFILEDHFGTLRIKGLNLRLAEYYYYKIHTLLMKSSAYPTPTPYPPSIDTPLTYGLTSIFTRKVWFPPSMLGGDSDYKMAVVPFCAYLQHLSFKHGKNTWHRAHNSFTAIFTLRERTLGTNSIKR